MKLEQNENAEDDEENNSKDAVPNAADDVSACINIINFTYNSLKPAYIYIYNIPAKLVTRSLYSVYKISSSSSYRFSDTGRC